MTQLLGLYVFMFSPALLPLIVHIGGGISDKIAALRRRRRTTTSAAVRDATSGRLSPMPATEPTREPTQGNGAFPHAT